MRTGNRLLDRLSLPDLDLLLGKSEKLHFGAQQIVFQADEPLEHVYFPVSALFSLRIGSRSNKDAGMEVASVGNEGMIGFTALLAVPASLHRATCRVAGECLRVPVAVLERAMARRPTVDQIMKRYMAVAYHALMQSAVCNALHPVEQRVCRWLLVTHERVPGEFPATQELLAASLGVKRPTISLVANSLLKAGLISYHRGTIRILDAAKLEQFACPCFTVARSAYARVLRR
jgi:CRP-like cAMP-binding protein